MAAPDDRDIDAAIALELDLLLSGLASRLSTVAPHILLQTLYEEADPLIERAGADAPYVTERIKLMAIDAGLLPRPDRAAHL